MKRILLGMMLFCVGSVYADSQGMHGSIGGNKLWLSSYTRSNEADALLSTGNILLGAVQVLTTGTASTIQFQEILSTSNVTWCPVYYGSSPALTWGYDTSRYPNGSDTIWLNQVSTMGWVYKTAGTLPAYIRILWDYVDVKSTDTVTSSWRKEK